MIKSIIDVCGIILEIYAASLMYSAFGRVKPLRWYYFVLGFCGMVTAAAITIYLFDAQFWILLAYAGIIFVLGTYFNIRFTSRLLITILLIAMFSVAETAMGMTMIGILGVSIENIQGGMATYAVGVFGSKLVSLILVLVLRFFVTSRKQGIESKWVNISVLFLPLQSLIFCFAIQRAVLVVPDNSLRFLSLFALLISFILIFVTILVIRNQIKSMRYKHELELASFHLRAQTEHYSDLYSVQQEIRAMSHNIKHELTALSGLLLKNNVSDALKYINETLVHIESISLAAYTDYPVIDAILNAKTKLASNHQISLRYKILIDGTVAIDQMDLAIILGNALDNAIEAVVRNTADDREIRLTIQEKSQYLFIFIDNHATEDFSDVAKTSKLDKANHGFGLSKIRMIVDKYDGNLSINYNEKTQRVSVQLLLKNIRV
jgi:hypothetical protein